MIDDTLQVTVDLQEAEYRRATLWLLGRPSFFRFFGPMMLFVLFYAIPSSLSGVFRGKVSQMASVPVMLGTPLCCVQPPVTLPSCVGLRHTSGEAKTESEEQCRADLPKTTVRQSGDETTHPGTGHGLQVVEGDHAVSGHPVGR